MCEDLAFELLPKRLVFFAVVVAVFGGMFAIGANAQEKAKYKNTTWTITIIATGANERPSYGITPAATTSGCDDPSNPNPSAKSLTVCPGDKINWVIKTKEGPSYPNPGTTYLFHEESILQDPTSGQAKQGFEGPNNKMIVSQVDTSAAAGEDDKYYVSVYDRSQQRLYIDDPKIIIGTGTRDGLVNQIKEACRGLVRLFESSMKTK